MSQLRFMFLFCLLIIQYAEAFIRYIVTYYDAYIYVCFYYHISKTFGRSYDLSTPHVKKTVVVSK